MSQAPVAITSPVAVGPPSMMPAAPSASSPARNSNTIILVIVIIAIVVFVVFLFTKLNTMNKELKELKAEREETAKWMKLVKAMAGQLGVQQDEKGEIHFVEKNEDDECEENENDEKSGAVCIDDGGQCDMKGPDIMLRPPPACLFNMFGSRVGGVRGGGVPVDMTAVFQQMMPTIDEEPTSLPAAAAPQPETKVSSSAPAAAAPQVPIAKVAESVSVD